MKSIFPKGIHIIFILLFSFIMIISCNHTGNSSADKNSDFNNNQQDDSMQEVLVVSDLLVEKNKTTNEAALTLDTIAQAISEAVVAAKTYSAYIVKSDKAYFYTDSFTIRKSYLIKDQELEGCCKKNGFIYSKYTNPSEKITEGWIKEEDLSAQ